MEVDPRKGCDFGLLHLTQVKVEFFSAQEVPKEAFSQGLSSSSWGNPHKVHHVGQFSSSVTSAKLPNLSELQFPQPQNGTSSSSQTFWSQDPFALLKIIEDVKELLFVYVASTDI